MPRTNGERNTWANPIVLYSDRNSMKPLRELIAMMREGQLLVPAYQRGRVWTQQNKALWVGHVLSWMPMPAIFIRQVTSPSGEWLDELLDGQQRLTAMLDWLDRKIPAVLYDGREVWCEDKQDAQMLYRINIPTVLLPPTCTEVQAIETYLRLNTLGVPHTPEELDKARILLEKAKSIPQ